MLPEPEGVAPVDVEGMDTLAASGSPLQIYKFISAETFWLFRNMSNSRHFNHADEAVSENSQSRQPEPIRENTPRPEMMELLETSMATRRHERVPVIGTDDALERFLKFRPLEFYGESGQETKAELFLEQLNDICGTLRHKDTPRVTFAAFRLRGMAKDWWLRASEARALKNQPWTRTDFQEEFKKEYIPLWVREQ
ncbi:hypothetical protein M9H77_06422 [Catharanthus roseus]|uniref:Uncharacterized protein n=1 Tax=Catharanthus roseus TaxID=4058 RepID=A0ACC0BS26_CATRO|nr:hypothetical protein M9H77_06422 [Catharanthus roseus]